MSFTLNPFTGALDEVGASGGGGGTPTGTANTLAFFDSGGSLNSDATISLDSSIKKLVLLTGSNTVGTNALTRGIASLNASTLGTNAGTDSFLNLTTSTVAIDSATRSFIRGINLTINGASGLGGAQNSVFVGSNATIGQNTSSLVGGFYGNIANTTNVAANSSNILLLTGILNATQTNRVSLTASTVGALIVGFSNLDGQILAFGAGSETRGFSTGSGSIIRTLGGQGSSAVGSVAAGGILSAGNFAASHARGLVSGTSSIIQSTQIAAQSFGYALSAGNITSSGVGSLAHGRVQSSGQIISSESGTLAKGYALNSGTITASAPGAIAMGGSDSSSISASGEGSIAAGQSLNGSAIEATSNGSLAIGIAVDGSALSAQGAGSIVFGSASAAGNITAVGEAAFSGGFSALGAVYASGLASFSFGTDIENNADLATSFGRGMKNYSYNSFFAGRFATTPPTSLTSWVDTDPLFVVGNGASDGSRNNALQLDKDGKLTTTAAKVNKAIRTVTGTTSVSARTDQTIIVDLSSAGSFSLNLPEAEDGLEFSFSTKSIGTGVYTLSPFAGDSLDLSIRDIITESITIVAYSNVWYSKDCPTMLGNLATTLAANTGSLTVITDFTNALNRIDSNGITADYVMSSDNGDIRSGNIYIAYNKAASTAIINDVYAETGTLLVTLDADISGGNLRLKYTNTDLTNDVNFIINIKQITT